jgi:hypothetical protein
MISWTSDFPVGRLAFFLLILEFLYSYLEPQAGYCDKKFLENFLSLFAQTLR